MLNYWLLIVLLVVIGPIGWIILAVWIVWELS